MWPAYLLVDWSFALHGTPGDDQVERGSWDEMVGDTNCSRESVTDPARPKLDCGCRDSTGTRAEPSAGQKLSSHRVRDKGIETEKRNHELRGSVWIEKGKLQALLQMHGLGRPSPRRGQRRQAHHPGRTVRQGSLVLERKVGQESGLQGRSWDRGAWTTGTYL